MISQYLITGTAWVAVSTVGQSIRAWIDQDYDGARGSMDIRIYSSDTTPGDSEFTISRRLYRLNSNNGAFIQEADGVFWVRAANANDQALVSVEVITPEVRPITLGDTAAVDAFGRLRVSLPRGIFEYQNQYNGAYLIWENVATGGATITHQPTESSVILSSPIGGRAIRQTRQYFRYRPGRSLFLIMTGVIKSVESTASKKIGYFDDNNGVFFKSDASGLSVVVRSDTSGTPVDIAIPRADWNINRLDGLGPDRITVDFDTAVIFWIDLEWLGVGRVRFGVVYNGIPYVCHERSHSNLFDKVYMRTANLPIRYEVDGAGSVKAICAGVSVEGDGDPEQGYDFAADTGATQFAITTTKKAVLSIRPKATFYGQVNRSGFALSNLSFMTESRSLRWELLYNPVVTGGAWVSVDDESTVEYNVTQAGYTGGKMIDSGFMPASQNARSSLEKVLNTRYPFALDRDGLNPINFTVTVQGIGGTGNASAGIGWREFY